MMDWLLDQVDKLATWIGRGDVFLGLGCLAVVAAILIVVALVYLFRLVSG